MPDIQEPLQKSSAYRRTAAICGRLADCARSPHDRDLLTRMQRSRLARAKNQEWLEGLLPLPPANSNALLLRAL